MPYRLLGHLQVVDPGYDNPVGAVVQGLLYVRLFIGRYPDGAGAPVINCPQDALDVPSPQRCMFPVNEQPVKPAVGKYLGCLRIGKGGDGSYQRLSSAHFCPKIVLHMMPSDER